jgi:hypothetical protein
MYNNIDFEKYLKNDVPADFKLDKRVNLPQPVAKNP